MTDIQVVSEPLVYRRDAEYSYFGDLITRSASLGDSDASRRLSIHGAQMREHADALEKRAERAWSDATGPGGPLAGVEYRVTPSRTTGQGGEFAPPLWLNELFATAPRTQRTLARLVEEAGCRFDLPTGVQSINVPRLTTGTQEQTDEDDTPTEDQDAVTTSTTSSVVTISGQEDVSIQLLEQSPAGAHLDWVFFKDLSEAYNQDLEQQLIYGAGSSAGQLTGITSLSLGNNAVSYTGSATATGMYPYFGRLISQVGNNRNQPPEAILMRTSRWAWLGTSEDTATRPLGLTDYLGVWPLGALTAFPVYPDDAIPTNVLAANQDEVIACKPSDLLLFESPQRTTVDLEPLSGILGARLILRGYAAFIGGRYPSGIATLTGSGMAIQAGFTT